MWNAFKYVYKSPWNHYFTLLDFPRVVSKCSGDDISDRVIVHQFCTRQLSPMCERNRANKWEWGLIGMRTTCTGFSRIALVSFKIIKYIWKAFDIWIQKFTIIFIFYEWKYWLKITAMSLLRCFIELFLWWWTPFPSTAQLAVTRLLIMWCVISELTALLSHLFYLKDSV